MQKRCADIASSIVALVIELPELDRDSVSLTRVANVLGLSENAVRYGLARARER